MVSKSLLALRLQTHVPALTDWSRARVRGVRATVKGLLETVGRLTCPDFTNALSLLRVLQEPAAGTRSDGYQSNYISSCVSKLCFYCANRVPYLKEGPNRKCEEQNDLDWLGER